MLLTSLILMAATQAPADYPFRPVSFDHVHMEGGFWGARLQTNRQVTVRYDFDKCAETGRLDNFAKAGGLMEGAHQGFIFDDSDVFKVIEGAAYTLATHPDPELDAFLDDLIAKIAAAQEDDGYLYTARTLHPDEPHDTAGPQRWQKVSLGSHELYNVGHLYEAAVAHFQATGKRSLLEIALKNAELVASVFGADGRHDVPGHQEIEIGLVKLFRITGERRFLDLARFFLDQRGHMEGRPLQQVAAQRAYWQDHLPVTQQSEAVGHAVRAAYMYSAMADVAALDRDQDYVRAIDRLWSNVTERKLYLTGGIGARHAGEAFGDDYELPNAEAYNETCAAIANALWNHRMFLLHGEARYVDVLERILYNGFLAGISLNGDRFFYPNPLASHQRPTTQGAGGRSAWFGCSCCPVNVVRFLPSLPGMIYATRGRSLYTNLYASGSAELEVGSAEVRMLQSGDYPWDGKVRLMVDAVADPAARSGGGGARFALHLRIPAWAVGEATPGGLYRSSVSPGWRARLNGKAIAARRDAAGYLVLDRYWRPGDMVDLEFDMPVRRTYCLEAVAANHGRVALERGPLVYCLEGVDHGGRVHDLVLRPQDEIRATTAPADLDPSGVLDVRMVLQGPAARAVLAEHGERPLQPAQITAIPYYAWAHRELGEMAVWLAEDPGVADPSPPPTLFSQSQVRVSHCWDADSAWAVNDLRVPQSSGDHSLPRLTFWPHRGGSEWIEIELAENAELGGFEVYWFDDSGQGQCRVPSAWRLLYRAPGDAPGVWQEVPGIRSAAPGATSLGIAADRFNRVRFPAVTMAALRLEVEMQSGFSAGILEMRPLSPSRR